jgi:hypothetical protein
MQQLRETLTKFLDKGVLSESVFAMEQKLMPQLRIIKKGEIHDLIDEYIRFLCLKICVGDITRTEKIDRVWRAHILDTTAYAFCCYRFIGFFVHYTPNRQIEASLSHTREMYLDAYGIRPPLCWYNSLVIYNQEACHTEWLDLVYEILLDKDLEDYEDGFVSLSEIGKEVCKIKPKGVGVHCSLSRLILLENKILPARFELQVDDGKFKVRALNLTKG